VEKDEIELKNKSTVTIFILKAILILLISFFDSFKITVEIG
jgi:hypothetical protein